ncbi:hypothetical protein V8J82_23330 [Gymnodinialimonas sp. 2305UL16-5]|uniref:hypothetical protein n=1 Tax=Gymnodinialimonas mytili TaxID=3126503 RepID=UPI0030B58E69
MPIARVNDTILFFVHVPKCGGTSIKRFLQDHGRTALDGRGGRDDWSRSTADHVHAAIYDHLVPVNFYDDGFIIFRDPVDRLRSEFRMFARPARRSWNPINWILAALARLRGRPLYGYQFFHTTWWVDPDIWVRGALLVARFMPYRGNNHYRPQSEFWREGLTPFFLEDGLDQVTDWIVSRTGLDPDISDKAPPREAPRLRAAQRQPRVTDVPFSEATIRHIKRHYAADYALFETLRARAGGPTR